MSISRVDGLNMRLDMLAEGILSLPRDVMAQVFKWPDLHTLATRIQRTWLVRGGYGDFGVHSVYTLYGVLRLNYQLLCIPMLPGHI